MEVVDNQDQGMNLGDLPAEIQQLPLHSPRRAGPRVCNLTMPGWRRLAHDFADRFVFRKPAERFNPWHEGFAFRQCFGAASAREVKCLSIMHEVVEKRVDERRLSETDVT